VSKLVRPVPKTICKQRGWGHSLRSRVLGGAGEREGVEWVVSEGVGAGWRKDPSPVCTYE
jgi:hypothetical protein